MATTRYPSSDLRRQVASPRPKGRDNKDTLCRNVVIYGHCRYEDSGCTFNHDQNKNVSNQADVAAKKSFNADSPSFTPSNQQQSPNLKKSTFSSQAASAAPFTPRGGNATTPPQSLQQHTETMLFNPAAAKEFTPQNYDLADTSSSTMSHATSSYSDPFVTMGPMSQTLPNTGVQFNLYSSDNDVMTGSGTTYFQQPTAFSASLQPLNYHLYAPYGPQRSDLQTWERATYDFFLPEKLREDLQKKMHATLQVLPNSTLPAVERWHSLVPIDTNNNRNANSFGYTSWVYKTQDARNGQYYALRRLGGFTLTNVNAILETLKEWRKIRNSNVVSVYETFTTRAFGDTSLIFIYDYHPLSKTLAEHHFPPAKHERKSHTIPEKILWSYICQITNALKAIHSANLAARCIELSKIILTGKNRIRLAACSIADVLQYGSGVSVQQKQREDLVRFGMVMLSLATFTLPVHMGNPSAALALVATKYSKGLKDAIEWLLNQSESGPPKTIDQFNVLIAPALLTCFELASQEDDNLMSHLSREVENGRVARLLMKVLMVMTEAEAHPVTAKWSPYAGELYPLKLFRSHVFAPVDENGNPAIAPPGHILTCMNKLDAGVDELVQLTSRNDDDVLLVSYRELKALLDRVFNDIELRGKNGNLFRR